jgi:hypothetical protein
LALGSWVAFWSGLEDEGWTALFRSELGAGVCPTAAPMEPNTAALPNSAAVIKASRTWVFVAVRMDRSLFASGPGRIAMVATTNSRVRIRVPQV